MDVLSAKKQKKNDQMLFEHPCEIKKKNSICNCQLSNSRHICLSLVDWKYEHIYKPQTIWIPNCNESLISKSHPMAGVSIQFNWLNIK